MVQTMGSNGGLPPLRHPIEACLSSIEATVDDVAQVRCWSLSDAELVALVGAAQRACSRVEELRLRLLAEADRRDAGKVVAATSTAAFLVAGQRTSRRTAGRDVRLAADLDGSCELVRVALGVGRVNIEQAQVICMALGCLPSEVSVEERKRAETHLIELAAIHGPEDLRILGRRIGYVIDPDEADAHEGRMLAAEEAQARAKALMTLRPRGDGRTRGAFTIPDAQAQMLQVALDALMSPRRHVGAQSGCDEAPDGQRPAGCDATTGERVDPDLDAERLTYERRMGLALCELIEHLPVDALPQAGRASPVITVDLDFDALVSGVGAATLSTGGAMSASQARRLACNAGLLPLVLGGDSVILDLGRTERFFTWYQRVALGKQQGGCVADGCARPPAWCEAHHCTPWSKGGDTDLGAGVLLCGFHHHLVHDTDWDVRIAADGIPEMLPPASIDPARTPIRHRRFRRRLPA